MKTQTGLKFTATDDAVATYATSDPTVLLTVHYDDDVSPDDFELFGTVVTTACFDDMDRYVGDDRNLRRWIDWMLDDAGPFHEHYTQQQLVAALTSAQARGELRTHAQDGHELASTIGMTECVNAEEFCAEVLSHLPVAVPLYRYDHGGTSYSTTPYACRWDSAQHGVVLVTQAKLWAMAVGDGNVRNCLVTSVQVLDDLAQGNVHGVVRHRLVHGVVRHRLVPDGDGSEGEWVEEDACWGFIGDVGLEHGLLDMLPRGATLGEEL